MIKDLVDNLTKKNTSDTFPFQIARKRLYMLPTPQGILFMVVLFVMLVGSINYNNNLGFLFTFLLSSMAFVSLLHTHNNMSGLILKTGIISPVFAGDQALLLLTLKSGVLDRTGICLGFKGEETVTVSLGQGKERQVAVPMATWRRGHFQIKALTLSSTYPFGLFKTWSTLYPDIGYLVYPKPLAGPFEFSSGIHESDAEGRIEIKGVDDFKEIRAYRPGDALSRLSWKIFSKGRGLYTKEFSAQAGVSLMLTWDQIPQKDPEKKLSRLCHMIQQAHRMNLRYGLTIPGKEIPPGEPKDPRHLFFCLKALALFDGGDQGGRI